MLNAQGQPITEVLASIPTVVPPPPPQSAVVQPYDFGPAGATFVPPMTMSLNYDPATLPSGVSESTLYIAYWDGSQWQKLTSTVDTAARTVTALVPHFSSFAVLGQVATASTTGLSGWLIAVIVVAVLIVIAVIVWLVVMRRRHNH
jgi:hypothetical protein